MKVVFGCTPTYTGSIEQPSAELVKNTLGLWNASVEDCLKFGGDLTRSAIGAMNLRNDRKYIVVDVKVHMLMKGQCPAIPGWHTDGVPRHANGSPAAGGEPNLLMQIEHEKHGIRPPRYHLLVTGQHCLTEAIDGQFAMDMEPEMMNSSGLYKRLSTEVNNKLRVDLLSKYELKSCTVAEWDWWFVHQGKISDGYEWRYLIRATETDHLTPETDLRKIIRTQQNVYVPSEFGW